MADVLFESIQMPHWSQIVTPNDIDTLHWVSTSPTLAGNFDKRNQYINDVLVPRGFKFMAGGTNRHVYRHLEIPNIVAKIPIDKVGSQDNIAEYKNQRKIWPYCAKMIQVVPTGCIGFAEKVDPILNRYQFNAYAAMIYILCVRLVGKYVLEDIGSDYFKNYGVRRGFGAVLVDYPYIFELDGNKLYCNRGINGYRCGGEIDYDAGFNKLYCKRCGRKYDAAELKMSIETSDIAIQISNEKRGGRKPMFVQLVKGDKVLSQSYESDSIVNPNKPKTERPSGVMEVSLVKGDTVLSSNSSHQSEITGYKRDDAGDHVSTTLSFDTIPSAPDPVPEPHGIPSAYADFKPQDTTPDEPDTSAVDTMIANKLAEQQALKDQEKAEEDHHEDDISEETNEDEEPVPAEKTDMSDQCGLAYGVVVNLLAANEISDEEYKQWMDMHCNRCIHLGNNTCNHASYSDPIAPPSRMKTPQAPHVDEDEDVPHDTGKPTWKKNPDGHWSVKPGSDEPASQPQRRLSFSKGSVSGHVDGGDEDEDEEESNIRTIKQDRKKDEFPPNPWTGGGSMSRSKNIPRR